MTDDIVNQLREAANELGYGWVVHTNRHAADEIERLRLEVKAWRKVANDEHAAWSQCGADCICLSNDFRKAINHV